MNHPDNRPHNRAISVIQRDGREMQDTLGDRL